jgi:hypothetical protein
VTCDVTLASIPLQVAANACYESQVTSGRNRGRPLCVCNLRLLLLILSIIGRGIDTVEVAGSSPVVPTIFPIGIERIPKIL